MRDGTIQWRRRDFAHHSTMLHAFAGMTARISLCGMAHRSKMRLGPGAAAELYTCSRCELLADRFGRFNHTAKRPPAPPPEGS